jgi:hypothetical protein
MASSAWAGAEKQTVALIKRISQRVAMTYFRMN